MRRFVRERLIAAPCSLVFAFHERPDAFSLLQPPWERTRILQPPTSLQVGTRVVVQTRIGPIWVTIEAEHVAYAKNERFEDVMRRGPFAHWHHRHLFVERDQGCLLRDEIEYALPFGPLGDVAARVGVEGRLARMFAYRHEVTEREVLRALASAPDASSPAVH
ncbi:MAG TPA: SRPBCC family protein [Polyangiales bacterium]